MIKPINLQTIEDYEELISDFLKRGDKTSAEYYQNDCNIAREVISNVSVRELLFIYLLRYLPNGRFSNYYNVALEEVNALNVFYALRKQVSTVSKYMERQQELRVKSLEEELSQEVHQRAPERGAPACGAPRGLNNCE